MICLSQDRFIINCDHNNRGGGVALVKNSNLNPKHIRMETILEIVVVQINATMQIIVISVYRPPSTPLDVFINGMLEVIAQFQNVPICIAGDLNEDVSITSNTRCCHHHHHQVSSVLNRLNVMDLHFSLFSAFLIHSL